MAIGRKDSMLRTDRIHQAQYGRGLRGKHSPAMLILGSFSKRLPDLIPTLFRIASDHEIGHIDITQSPEAVDLERLKGYTLVFAAFELYRDNESFFRMLPDSIRSRITVLAKPADFPSVAPEIKCACYCSELKALLPREEAQLLDHHPASTAPR